VTQQVQGVFAHLAGFQAAMPQDYDDDVALFSTIMAQERQALAPVRGSTLSETLAASADPRARALASNATASHDESDVPFLLSLLSSVDPAVLEAAADAIWKLAIGGRARAAVHKANGARPLVALLAHKEPRVVRVAAGAVSILALDGAHRTIILASGGAGALAGVLNTGGEREAEQAARATTNLAADDVARTSLIDHSVSAYLAMRLQRRRSPATLREAVCRAIAALASSDGETSARAANEFAEAGGMMALVDALQPGGGGGGDAATSAAGMGGGGGSGGGGGGGGSELSEALIAAGMAAAAGGAGVGVGGAGATGLSARAPERAPEGLEGQLVTIVGVAARPELNGQRGAVVAFHSATGRYHVRLDSGETVALRPNSVQLLSAAAAAAAAADGSNSPLLKAAVRAARSLAMHRTTADDLVRLGALPSLISHLGSRTPEIAAASAYALGALATVEAHRPALLSARAVAMLLRCLGEGTDRSVQEPACAALRALALHPAVRAELADARKLGPIVAVLSRGDAQAREAAAGLLGSIALHAQGRRAMLDAGAVPPLIKLLPLRHEPTQEAAARALKNLAFEPDGVTQIAKAGGTQPLVRLLKSGSEALHSAASAALEVLTMEAHSRERVLKATPSWLAPGLAGS